MQFQTLDELISMGGHGIYVWAAYGITLSVLIALVWGPLARRRRALARISQLARLKPEQGSEQG